MAYARHQFALAKKVNGKPQRAHLKHLAENAKVPGKREWARKELAGPPMPRGYAPLWDAFMDLDRWRGVGAMSMAPLTLHDVEAWERRFLPDGCRFAPDELDIIKRLDGVALTG